MANRFNEYINSDEGGSVEFVRLSSGIATGTQVMLVRPLMDYEAGSVFTYAPAKACEGGKVYRYKGIGEACFFDGNGNPIVLKGGKHILDESFILLEDASKTQAEEVKSQPTPEVRTPKAREVLAEARRNRSPDVIKTIQGEDGIPGIRGPKGAKGDKGDRGEKGDKGDRGEQGEQGDQGEQGEHGSPGTQGERGTDGEKGEKGDQGEKGEEGAAGSQGSQGERGVSGLQGEKGEKGERGDIGSQGLQGAKGDKGDQGERGSNGEDGERGEKGDRGDKGDTGDQGERGTQGIQGVAGENGLVGSQGERGEKGDRGDDGDQGEQGERGEKGSTGDSGVLSVQYPLKLDKANKHLSIDLSKIKPMGGSPILYDGGGGLGEAFKFISVSGQSGLTAVQYDKETLTLVAGTNIVLTTDPENNSITINSSGGGGTGSVSGITGNYVATINGITGALGLTVSGNLTLTMTGADNKTFNLSSKPPATVKGSAAGVIAWGDTSVSFAGDGLDLGADNAFKFNYLTDLALETPGSIKLGTLYGTDSFIQFGDGTTQGTAAKCCPPLATTGSTGVASFDNNYFQLGSTGHVSIKTGIKAGNIITLGTSTVFGAGATGALPALDGSLLLEVNAKFLQGKTPNQLTDGGTF